MQPSWKLQPAGSCGAVAVKEEQEVADELRLFCIDVYVSMSRTRRQRCGYGMIYGT